MAGPTNVNIHFSFLLIWNCLTVGSIALYCHLSNLYYNGHVKSIKPLHNVNPTNYSIILNMNLPEQHQNSGNGKSCLYFLQYWVIFNNPTHPGLFVFSLQFSVHSDPRNDAMKYFKTKYFQKFKFTIYHLKKSWVVTDILILKRML